MTTDFDISKYVHIFDDIAKINEPSAWKEHIPFAFFLIEILKPNIFVELGVDRGISYFAFCQTVKAMNISTKCYGIDTWLGDEHVTKYDKNIYFDLINYNNSNYAAFSSLLKMTFSEGLKYFSDKSIDLLHIDGCHTYEAVKTDFENWLPKLSDRGVVVFHDTMVRERSFGVWKFWEEVKDKHSSYNFTHCNGLGILAVGKNVSKGLITFLKNSNINIFYQNLFKRLGDYVFLKDELFLKSLSNRFIQLYIDTGTGFSEENSHRKPVKGTTEQQEFVFNLHSVDIKALRLDPLNDSTVITMEKVSVINKSGEIDLFPKLQSNACKSNYNKFFFQTDDPSFYYSNKIACVQKLIVHLKYEYRGCDAVNECINQFSVELNKTKGILDQTKRELDQTKSELDQTKSELDQTILELDQTKSELDQTKSELDQTILELDQTKSELDQIKNELNQIEGQLTQIANGWSFRIGSIITKPARTTKKYYTKRIKK